MGRTRPMHLQSLDDHVQKHCLARTIDRSFGLRVHGTSYLQCRGRLAACFIAFDAIDLSVHHVFELIGATRARIMLTEFARVRLAIFA